MSRRRVAAMLVVTAVALSAPTSARPASAADDAATVNGETISVEDFEALVDAAGQVAPDYVPDPATDTVGAGQGRELLKILILNRLRPDFLAEHGVELTDGDLAAAEESLAANEAGDPLPEPLRSELVSDTALSAAVAQLEVPGEAELAEIYDESPAQAGVLCLNVISIIGDADRAAEDLRDGESARDVVAAVGDGSRVQDECLSLGELGLTVPGLFHDLVGLRPGETLDPIETPSGHQILQVAEFDDIAGELVGYFADPPVSPGTGQPQTVGDLLLMGYVVTADVSVNPRYGRWDAATASIVPLGQP